jgi:hypothetical protein
MNRLRPALLAALLITGCIPDVAKLDPYRSAEAFCPVLYDVYAAKFTECLGVASYLEPTIYSELLLFCTMATAGEKAGRMGFDRTKAEGAIAAAQSMDCASFGLPKDLNPFIPLVGVGGACVTGEECTAASVGCFNPTLTCPGHCLALGTTAGVACGGWNPDCGDAFYCAVSVSGTSPTCQATLGTGATGCSTGSPPCKASDYCDSVAVPSTCKPLGAAGAACTSNSQCDYRNAFYCNTTSGKCFAANYGATAGQSCAYPNRCASGLWCDATSICQAPLPLGAACSGDGACGRTGNGCVSDSTTVGALSHCRIRLAEGASCMIGVSGCQPGLYCSGSAAGAPGICARSPKIGQACGTILGERVNCLDGWCDRPGTPQPLQGTCTAPYPAWATCTGNECGTETLSFGGNQCTDVTGTSGGSGKKCVPSCIQGGTQGTTY